MKQPQHIVQSKAWENVRSNQGSRPLHLNDQLLLIKPAPGPFKNLGIISQADVSQLDLANLLEVGREQNLSHIQIDPNNLAEGFSWDNYLKEYSSAKNQPIHLTNADSLLLRHTQLINLQKDDDTLLSEMKKNWRYNCKYSLRKGVTVEFRKDSEALEKFIKIYFATVEAKDFLGRRPEYFRQVWEVMSAANKAIVVLGELDGEVAVGRMLFLHKDTIYTAYTGTSRKKKHSKSKAAYGVMWEIMQWGKKQGYKTLNMWGVDPNAEQGDPEYGYTRFKTGFGGRVVKLAPAKNLIIDPLAYRAFTVANQVRLKLARWGLDLG